MTLMCAFILYTHVSFRDDNGAAVHWVAVNKHCRTHVNSYIAAGLYFYFRSDNSLRSSHNINYILVRSLSATGQDT